MYSGYICRQAEGKTIFIHSFIWQTLIRAFQLSPREPKRVVGVGLQGLTVKWEPATDWGSLDLRFKKPLLVFKAFKYHLLSHSWKFFLSFRNLFHLYCVALSTYSIGLFNNVYILRYTLLFLLLLHWKRALHLVMNQISKSYFINIYKYGVSQKVCLVFP